MEAKITSQETNAARGYSRASEGSVAPVDVFVLDF